jgi:hypothetical protein
MKQPIEQVANLESDIAWRLSGQRLGAKVESILRASGANTSLILNSTMGEYNGASGAAALAVHEWKPAR